MSRRELLAVALSESGRIAGHAGRALAWDVYDLRPGVPAVRLYSLALEDDACLHEYHTSTFSERHPLHGMDVVLAASAGEGVTRRLAERGVRLLTTSESDPLKAIEAYRHHVLPGGQAHDEAGCSGHGHAQPTIG